MDQFTVPSINPMCLGCVSTPVQGLHSSAASGQVFKGRLTCASSPKSSRCMFLTPVISKKITMVMGLAELMLVILQPMSLKFSDSCLAHRWRPWPLAQPVGGVLAPRRLCWTGEDGWIVTFHPRSRAAKWPSTLTFWCLPTAMTSEELLKLCCSNLSTSEPPLVICPPSPLVWWLSKLTTMWQSQSSLAFFKHW